MFLFVDLSISTFHFSYKDKFHFIVYKIHYFFFQKYKQMVDLKFWFITKHVIEIFFEITYLVDFSKPTVCGLKFPTRMDSQKWKKLHKLENCLSENITTILIPQFHKPNKAWFSSKKHKKKKYGKWV